MNEISKEKSYLLSLLAKQDYSSKQLSDKLHKRGNISSEEIETLLNEFQQNKWLSDQRFAENFIISEVSKLRGKKKIINTAIYQKGLSQELIEDSLEKADIDWFELCEKALAKKYHDIEKLQSDAKLKQKAINYLLYNGFSIDEIKEAINKTM